MLTFLLATGVIGGAVTGTPGVPVITPAQRVITVTPTGTFPSAQQHLDPSDVMDFVVDLSGLLADGEEFAVVNMQVSAEAVLQGFQLLQTAPYAPTPLDDSRVRIWATVLPGSRDAATWTKVASCQIEITATTTSAPPRTWQRTVQIQVGQR